MLDHAARWWATHHHVNIPNRHEFIHDDADRGLHLLHLGLELQGLFSLHLHGSFLPSPSRMPS